jgi:hypothetical protein
VRYKSKSTRERKKATLAYYICSIIFRRSAMKVCHVSVRAFFNPSCDPVPSQDLTEMHRVIMLWQIAARKGLERKSNCNFCEIRIGSIVGECECCIYHQDFLFVFAPLGQLLFHSRATLISSAGQCYKVFCCTWTNIWLWFGYQKQ